MALELKMTQQQFTSCVVFAKNMVRFTQFCQEQGVNPRDKNIICAVYSDVWRQLRNISPDETAFVFLADWDEDLFSRKRNEARRAVLNKLSLCTDMERYRERLDQWRKVL